MDDNIHFISFLQEQLGWAKTLIIIGFLVFLAFFAKSMASSMYETVKEHLFKKNPFKKRSIDLKNHPIFSKYNLIINQLAKNIRCHCPLRKKIFSDLLVIRLNVYNEELKALATRTDLKKLSSFEYQYEIHGLILKMYSSWEQPAREKGIPEIVIKRFQEAIIEINDTVLSTIQSIAGANYFFDDNESRTSIIFDILSSLEGVILAKLEEVLDDMNGEISSLTYQSQQCQHCTSCQSKHLRN